MDENKLPPQKAIVDATPLTAYLFDHSNNHWWIDSVVPWSWPDVGAFGGGNYVRFRIRYLADIRPGSGTLCDFFQNKI